jgi:hypothetical protein
MGRGLGDYKRLPTYSNFMSAATKIKGRYLSTLEANYSTDYNCSTFENVYFIKRIINCLKKGRATNETQQIIIQLQDLIIEHQENVKLKQGAESYPGLMIQR